MLRKWIKQIETDQPAGHLSVVINTANGFNPVAILPIAVYKLIALQVGSMTIVAEESFAPAIELQKLEKSARIYGILLGKENPPFSGAIAFEAEEGKVVVAVNAVLWLMWALHYEAKLVEAAQTKAKENGTLSESRLELVK